MSIALSDRRTEPAAERLETLMEDAAELERLLPALMRRLFTLDLVSDLPLAQLRVCTILQSGPRSISQLSDELGISASAVTQIADRLERGDLVERVAEPDDRRMRNLRLTSEGQRIMSERREARVRRAAGALGTLSPKAREAALEAVRALLAASTASAQRDDSRNGAEASYSGPADFGIQTQPGSV